MKYKAEIKYTRDKYKLVNHTDFLKRGIIDSNGYIYGYYVDGAIVGKFTDLNDEYINLEYWCEVDIDTLELVEKQISDVDDLFDQKLEEENERFN